MNEAQIAKLAAKAAKRKALTERAVADLRQRVDTNAVVLCDAMRRENAHKMFAFEDQCCPVQDLPHWALVEWINSVVPDEYDARLRAARMRSIEAVEKAYGVYLKEERAWYAYLEEKS